MKLVQSFSKLVELIKSNKVYSYRYDIVEKPSELCVNISSKSDVICKSLLDDVCDLCRVYSNLSYYCTTLRDKVVLCVYIKFF